MDGDIITRLDAEEADLLRKLKAIRDLKAAYGVRPEDGSAAKAVTDRKASSRPKVGMEGYGPYGRIVVAEAMRFLLLATEPMKTRELVPMIEAMGITITGENKINALGALLGRSQDIVSHGKAGWTLANKDVARTIVAQYGQNENEASKADADDASETRGWGAPPPPPPAPTPNLWPGA